MKTLVKTTIVTTALAAAIVLPLAVKADSAIPPVYTWHCDIHNQTAKPVDYQSNLGSGEVAAQGTKHLGGATSGLIGHPSIKLNWTAGSCTVKYESSGVYPSTDKNVNCVVNGDDVIISPLS